MVENRKENHYVEIFKLVLQLLKTCPNMTLAVEWDVNMPTLTLTLDALG